MKPITVTQAFEALFMNPHLPPGQRTWVEELAKSWSEFGLSRRQREVLQCIHDKYSILLEPRDIQFEDHNGG